MEFIKPEGPFSDAETDIISDALLLMSSLRSDTEVGEEMEEEEGVEEMTFEERMAVRKLEGMGVRVHGWGDGEEVGKGKGKGKVTWQNVAGYEEQKR